ncbi:MAG: GFA family protein [Actinomycetia bacterium]|nr:GFA family protein [Actinomycetes bacterium]
MTDTIGRPTGGCLCGGVTYETHHPLHRVLQCHCSNCRRTSGNFVAAVRSATDELVINDPADHLRWYDLEYASYGFCGRCGSTLFFRSAERQDITSVMTGTLDDATDLMVHGVWFAADAQPHNTLPPNVPHYDGNG